MSINRPYFRTCRQFRDGSYAEGGKAKYIELPQYAKNAQHYIRAFILIQKDLLDLFDYIEPADQNLATYSFRIHELLLRACVEVEANFKAILRENGYKKHEKNWNITDYQKIEGSHFLSSYQITIPYWDGKHNTVKPFEEFSSENKLSWYSAYNNTKHDRYENFKSASFKNLISAVAGLLALLSSQFYTRDFSPSNTLLAISDGKNDGTEAGIGEYFRIKFPDIPFEERYSFDYADIQRSEFQCVKYDYD